MVQTRRIHSCHGQVEAVDLFEEEDEGGDLDDSDHTDLPLLISYLDLKYDMIMVLLLIRTKPHTPYPDLKYAVYDDDNQDEDVDFDEDRASPRIPT